MKTIKERVRDEVHASPSEIFNQERLVLQQEHHVSIIALGLYLREYKHYKSGFDAIRKKNKPKIPKEIDDIDFESEQYIKFTRTIDDKAFLQYDNKSKNGRRIQIFASEIGMKLLSESKRWQSDGTFYAAPKPFKQLYYIIVKTLVKTLVKTAGKNGW